ncbi:MAG: universal stress protein [Aureliella sp.]
MQPYKNILVAVDVAQSAHPELERAQQLARASGGSLHIVDVLRDMNVAARLLSTQWKAGHEALANEKTRGLEALAESSRSQRIETTCELLRGKFSQQLIQVAEARKIDLLVRTAKGAHSSEPGPIGSTSNQLLRRAPCDLWLTQGENAGSCKRILAAIDATPDDQAHAALNRIILQRSLDLVEHHGCELQVVYAWDVFGAEMIRHHMSDSEFEETLERNRVAHEESYERELSEFGLHARDMNVHMLRGEPVVVIPAFCRAREIDLIVCGTVARGGISGVMIGNTANRILNRIPCSILALKPQAG